MRGDSRFLGGLYFGLVISVFLACGVEARSDVMRPNITYSTTGPEPMRGPTEAPVFEFRGVENGVLTPGSDFKLGTFLIHQQEPNKGFTFDNSRVILNFQITRVDGAAVATNETPLFIEGRISGSVYPDGTIAAGINTFWSVSNSLDPWNDVRLSSFQVGDLKLTLGPVASDDGALWNLTPGTPMVEVEIYGRIEAVPVPEPGTWIVFAGAMALFAGIRSRRTKV